MHAFSAGQAEHVHCTWYYGKKEPVKWKPICYVGTVSEFPVFDVLDSHRYLK